MRLDRTQGNLFQLGRQRAPLSTLGPLAPWVSVWEGVEPVGRGGSRGEGLKTSLPTQLR